MVVASPPVAEAASRPTLRLQRRFAAPRELVWRAWTRPEVVVLWLGPVEWPAVNVSQDLRVGGGWRACLRSPDTCQELWQGGVYREIVEPERIVFTFKWEGDNHEDGAPVDTLVSVRFTEVDDNHTVIDFTHQGLKDEQSVAGHAYGWNSTADRLEAWLAAHPD